MLRTGTITECLTKPLSKKVINPLLVSTKKRDLDVRYKNSHLNKEKVKFHN